MTCVVAREAVGVLRMRGKDRLDLLQRLSTNDLRPLVEPDTVRQTVFTTHQGKILDWVWIYSTADALLLRTSQGRAQRLKAWIERYTILEDATLDEASEGHALLVLHGSDAVEAAGIAWPEAERCLVANGIVWARGPAAYEHRLEAIVPGNTVDTTCSALITRGAQVVDAAWLGEQRLRAGVPSPNAEFRDEVNPLELRLGSAVSWSKGCYVGQEVIARLDSYDKVARLLMGFEGDASVLPEAGTRLGRAGRTIGRVTSATLAVSGCVGLAVVERASAAPGEADLLVGGDARRVQLVDRPFWSGGLSRPTGTA